MSRETDRVMKEVHKFLTENVTGDMSREQIDALLEPHLAQINARVSKELTEETAVTADDLVELAEKKLDEGDEQGALRLARKALKMDPDHLDAEMIVLNGESDDPETFLTRLRQLTDKGKLSLQKQGFFDEDCIGKFWQILETRPYIRLKAQYAFALMEIGKIRAAAREAEEIIALNNDDNMGNRFFLMHLYAFLEDAQGAERLMSRYGDIDEGGMLLPITLMYYKLGDTARAEKYLRRLVKSNKETKAFVRDVFGGITEKLAAAVDERGGYVPFTEEELACFCDEYIRIYDSAPYFFNWVAKELKIQRG